MDTGYEKLRKDSPEISNDYYRKLIGALLYLSVNTRPDISAPVALLAQHIKGTKQVDWDEAQRVCRYLKGTIHYKLKLSDHGEQVQTLIGYADANWAEDRITRISNSGYIFKYFGGAISWVCRKQDIVTTSSTAAEIVALHEASIKCVWIRKLLEFFNEHQSQPTIINEDNQSCIKIMINGRHTDGSKHIDTKYLKAKELMEKLLLMFEYCPTELNAADILTKPLGGQRTKTLASMIGLITEDPTCHQ